MNQKLSRAHKLQHQLLDEILNSKCVQTIETLNRVLILCRDSVRQTTNSSRVQPAIKKKNYKEALVKS